MWEKQLVTAHQKFFAPDPAVEQKISWPKFHFYQAIWSFADMPLCLNSYYHTPKSFFFLIHSFLLKKP